MGRRALGDRKQVNVRLPVDLIRRIDAKRGVISRDAWMGRACELALKPTSVLAEPELAQVEHVHTQGRMLKTEFDRTSGARTRYYECSECGGEVVVRAW